MKSKEKPHENQLKNELQNLNGINHESVKKPEDFFFFCFPLDVTLHKQRSSQIFSLGIRGKAVFV